MRNTLEESGAKTDNVVHLKRRLGLFSGVALIVGTMIGKKYHLFQFKIIVLLHTLYLWINSPLTTPELA